MAIVNIPPIVRARHKELVNEKPVKQVHVYMYKDCIHVHVYAARQGMTAYNSNTMHNLLPTYFIGMELLLYAISPVLLHTCTCTCTVYTELVSLIFGTSCHSYIFQHFNVFYYTLHVHVHVHTCVHVYMYNPTLTASNWHCTVYTSAVTWETVALRSLICFCAASKFISTPS